MTLTPGHDQAMSAPESSSVEEEPAPELEEIVARYRRDRRPEATPLATARSTLEWAGDGLDDVELDILMEGAHASIRRDGAPRDAHLAPETVTVLQEADRLALTTRKPYLDLPRGELLELMAVGLVELGRWQEAAIPAEEPVSPAGAELDLDYRSMSADEYRRWVYADRQGEGVLDLVFGWLPGAVVGFVAGIVAALVSGDWTNLLIVLLVGAIGGYVATGLGHVVLAAADVAVLRLGHRLEPKAWGLLYFGTGPLLALATAALLMGST